MDCFGGLSLTIVLQVRNLHKERGRVPGRPDAAARGHPWQTMLSHRVSSVIQYPPCLRFCVWLPSVPSRRRVVWEVSRAAAAPNVSTSAVSRQIRGLEESLGVRLLERSTGVGGVRVTLAGTKLLTAASSAVAPLEAACSDIRDTTRQLTVSANVSLSTMCLARRLAEFSALHPEVAVSAIIQLEEPAFARYGIDLAIMHVPEGALRPDDEVLLHEEVFPVCSHDLDLYSIASQEMCRCRLWREAHEDNPEVDCGTWASELTLPRDFESEILRYSTFSRAIGAAVGGLGRRAWPVAADRSRVGKPAPRPLVPGLSRPASWRFVLRRRPSRRHQMLGALTDFLRDGTGGTGWSSVGLLRGRHVIGDDVRHLA